MQLVKITFEFIIFLSDSLYRIVYFRNTSQRSALRPSKCSIFEINIKFMPDLSCIRTTRHIRSGQQLTLSTRNTVLVAALLVLFCKDKMVLNVGRKAAKGLLHNKTMFPTDDCFIPNNEENSFSSLLKETFHDDSIYKDDKEFLMLLSSNRSVWYTCCNEVRGSLIFKSKDIYFREYNQ